MNTRSQGLLKAARYFVALATILLAGCVIPVDLSKVELGMTKDEVIRVLGTPYDYKAKGNVTFLMYMATGASTGAYNQYYVERTTRYVKLVDGKVESFGAIGDFDSTKDPTLNLNIKNR